MRFVASLCFFFTDLYCKKDKELLVLPGFMEEGTHHICVYIG